MPYTSTTSRSSTFEMGYGSALAWIFAAIMIIITLIQFRLANGWVFYGGEY